MTEFPQRENISPFQESRSVTVIFIISSGHRIFQKKGTLMTTRFECIRPLHPSKPGAIIFDLDDTILAFDAVSKPVWIEVCQEFCSKHTLTNPDRLFRAIEQVSNRYWSDPERHRTGRLDLYTTRRVIVTNAFNELGIDPKPLANELADSYSERRLEAMYAFPGAIETLKELQNSGIPLVLLTNGDSLTQRQKLQRFDLTRFFKAILIEGELGYGKPESRVFIEAALRAGSTRENCWIVGDNLEWEIKVPQQLGFFTIWHDYLGKGLPRDSSIIPHLVIRSLSDIISFLKLE